MVAPVEMHTKAEHGVERLATSDSRPQRPLTSSGRPPVAGKWLVLLAAASRLTGLAVVRLLRPARSRGRSPSRVVTVSRVAHGLVSVLFLLCIAVVYAGAWRASAGPLTFAAVGALLLEGVLVLLSHGNCPLGPLFRQLGDDTPFFQLLLPPRAAKLAVPLLAAVTALGIVLLASRTLWA